MKNLIFFLIFTISSTVSGQLIPVSQVMPGSCNQVALEFINSIFGPIASHNVIRYHEGPAASVTLQNSIQGTYLNAAIDTATVYDSFDNLWKYMAMDTQVGDSFSVKLYNSSQALEFEYPLFINSSNDSVSRVHEVGGPPFGTWYTFLYDTLGRMYRLEEFALGETRTRDVFYTGQSVQFDSIVHTWNGASQTYTATYIPSYSSGILDSVYININGFTQSTHFTRNAQGELTEVNYHGADVWGDPYHYRWQFLNGTIGLTEIENNEQKELIKILDLMGRETEYQSNTPLIYVYSDGSTEKVYVVH